MSEIHCKGNYVRECDMKDCHETICDWCEHRVLHELCNDKGIEVMNEKLRKPRIGEQFARVCWDCADILNKLGVPTSRFKRFQVVSIFKNGKIIEKVVK